MKHEKLSTETYELIRKEAQKELLIMLYCENFIVGEVFDKYFEELEGKKE